MKKAFAILLFLTLSVLFSQSNEAATLSTVLPDFNVYLGGFGKGAQPALVNESVGQLFSVPSAEPVLTSFSFWLYRDAYTPVQLTFSAYVMAWGTDRATGPVLFNSGPVLGPGTPETRTRYDFAVPGLALSPGLTYAAFLSTAGLWDLIPAELAWSEVWMGQPAAGVGALVQQNSENDTGAWTAQPWSSFADWPPLAFEAHFEGEQVIPEPSTLLLLSSGLVGIFTWGKKKLFSN